MTWTCDQDQLLQSAGRAAHAQSRWRSSGRSVGAWWRGTVAARIWPLFANQQTYERRRRIALFLFLASQKVTTYTIDSASAFVHVRLRPILSGHY